MCRSETREMRRLEDTESGRKDGKRAPPPAEILASGKSRRKAAESSARVAAVIGLGLSRRRIRLEILLASVRRSMPRFRRYWLPCSREQKSSPAPTQIRLRGLPHNKQVLALIFRLNYRQVNSKITSIYGGGIQILSKVTSHS